MPVSKPRKKRGRSVSNGEDKRKRQFPTNVTSMMNTLTELTQISKALDENTKLLTEGDIPVTAYDEDGKKIRVGTATPIPDDPDHISVSINEEHIEKYTAGLYTGFSIEKRAE